MRNEKVKSIGDYIREQREQARISMRQLAQAAGVSNPYLSQIERGLRKPSADILQQIAKGLRISAEALYVQAGILEDRPSDSGVRSALLTDPDLSERQKQVLMEIYESFRKENSAAADAGPAPAPEAEAEAVAHAAAEAQAAAEARAAAEAQARAAAEAVAQAAAEARAAARPSRDAWAVAAQDSDAADDPQHSGSSGDPQHSGSSGPGAGFGDDGELSGRGDDDVPGPTAPPEG